MGISIFISLNLAAALSPLVLQLGPSESTRIFWNYESQIRRGQKCDCLSCCLARRDGKPYPERGVASGVSWVQERELGSWIAVDIIICDNSENTGDNKVFKPTVRESSTRLAQ